MGVEPTRQNLSTRLIGFEDRGRHPPSYARHKYTNSFRIGNTKTKFIFDYRQTMGLEDREPIRQNCSSVSQYCASSVLKIVAGTRQNIPTTNLLPSKTRTLEAILLD